MTLLICKYYGEISSNSVWTASKNPSYIFFKMRNSLFFILQGLAQTKTIKVAVFKTVSFESHPAHISLNKKTILVTGVNLVTEFEQP